MGRYKSFSNLIKIIILLNIFLIKIIYGDKINERRILLPYNSGIPTNFTLETFGDNSCYKWSSSRPDIASVKPLNDETNVLLSTLSSTTSSTTTTSSLLCSKIAIVTVVSTIPKRQSTIITALDVKTNQQIRCDVEIDRIDRILIETVTKEIVLGEQPEAIKVVAFTDKNDIFTSIGGVPFEWSLMPTDVLRYRQWSTSTYAAPDFVEYWESRGQKSSYILVEGIKTGSATIQTNIIGDSYRTVKSDSIQIHVVANLLLIPSNDVYLVPGATVHFRAEISKQGPRVPLNFPNQQYYLEVNDPEIARFNEQTNLLEALQEGQTTLVLKDRNMDQTSSLQTNLLFSRTRTDIHVKQPGYISMSIYPGDKFQLCNDLIYQLELSLHDENQNQLYPSDNLDFELKFQEEFLEILQISSNKTYYLIRTKKIGLTKLQAEFHGAGIYRLNEPLIHQQDVTIYPPIQLIPSEIYLPFIRSIQTISYTVHVNAQGATGSGYNWQSANESLASIKYTRQDSSKAIILAKSLQGEVTITCTDIHDPLIFNAQTRIHILPIDGVEILPSIVEAEIGSNVYLPIAVLSILKEKKFYFDDCSHVKFNVEIVEKNRIRYDPDSFVPGLGSNSCRSLQFECIGSGNSRLKISYQATEDKIISTQAIIGCFKPLKLVHPVESAVLSLGARIDLAFEGGPRPWSMYPEGHYKRAQPSNTSLVETQEIKDRYRFNKDLHVFRVQCLQYGQTKINLQVGNDISPTLPNPASTNSMVEIQCSPPETLIIKPKTKQTCPQQDGQYTMEKNRKIELDLEVLDQQGQTFYNASTFYFEWSKNSSAGIFEETNSILEEVNAAHGYQILRRSYQILSGLTTNDKTRVRCRIIGYQQSRRYPDQFDIRREIELITTDPLITNENSVTILKHQDYSKLIQIDKGSGYFSIDWTVKRNLEIELINKNEKRKQPTLLIRPLNCGNGIITISDLCLDYQPFQISYSVVEPIDIKLELVDKIQLGDKIEGIFYILDNRGNKLHSSLHSYLDLTIISSNNFLTIGEIQTKNDYYSTFSVKAERLGHCKILLQSQSTKISRTIQSTRIDVQIFSPLQIWPSNITLIVGNYFQPNFLDGPQTQRNIEFSIDDTTVAHPINSDGLIQALKIGRTKILARVTSVNNNYEYSRAQADLFVLPLKKIKIWSPIHQVLIGSTIPLYLIGNDEQNETPFMFGNSDPPLKIRWSLSNDKIATLDSSFQKFGIIENQKFSDQISASFHAKSIGSVTVKVQVEITTSPIKDPLLEQIHRNRILTDSIQIKVNPDYNLIVSSPTDLSEFHHSKQIQMRTILMSPQSELLLHQNQLDQLDYQILNNNSSSSSSLQTRLFNQTGNLLIQAGDLLESTTLLIKRDLHRTGLQQFYSQAIQVDKVRFISLEFDLNKYSQEELATLNLDSFPIGSDISMSIQYHDQLGRRFDSVKSNIKWMLNRNDIINLINSIDSSSQSIQIRSLKPGSVVLKIWDDINQVGQFYKINVGQAIIGPEIDGGLDQPLKLLSSEILCMRTKMDESSFSKNHHHSNNKANGKWYLDQDLNSLGWIHPNYGVLLALNPGNGLVIYNHSTTISTYKHLQIKPFKKIMLSSESLVGLSTLVPHYIPIILLNENEKPTTTSDGCTMDTINLEDLQYNGPLPFQCDASLNSGDPHHHHHNNFLETLWNIELQYKNHHWNCLLIPKFNLDLDSIALWNQNVTISVIYNSGFGFEQQQYQEDYLYNSLRLFHQIQLPLLPAFQTTIKQIILTPTTNSIRFTINSVRKVLDEMLIKSSNEDIISVQKLYEDDDVHDNVNDINNELQDQKINSNSLRILVSLKNFELLSNDLLNLHLILYSKLLNQTEKIPIQLKLFTGNLNNLNYNQNNNQYNQLLQSTTNSILFYNLIYLLITILLGSLIIWLMKKFTEQYYFYQKQKMIYMEQLSPKTPRIIDYHQKSPTTGSITGSNSTNRSGGGGGGIGSIFGNFSNMTPLVRNSGGGDTTRIISSSSDNNGTPTTPTSALSTSTSPKVGRPLYSTRSYFN